MNKTTAFVTHTFTLTVEGVELFLLSPGTIGLGGTLVELLDPFRPASSAVYLLSPVGLLEYETRETLHKRKAISRSGLNKVSCYYNISCYFYISPWSVVLRGF